jgi:hypothetical protein
MMCGMTVVAAGRIAIGQHALGRRLSFIERVPAHVGHEHQQGVDALCGSPAHAHCG